MRSRWRRVLLPRCNLAKARYDSPLKSLFPLCSPVPRSFHTVVYGFCFFFPHRLYLFYIQTLFVLFENFKRNAYKKKGDSKKKKN